MARGNVNMPSDLWEETRTALAGQVTWTKGLVVQDLRYWSDEIACEGRPRPSVRELADAWGWSKSRVARALKAWDSRGTAVGQSRDTRPATNADSRAPVGHPWDTRGTPVGQPLVDTRARSSHVSTSLEDPPNPPGDVEALSGLGKGSGVVTTSLVDDPERLRATHMKHSEALATLLEHSQKVQPGYAYEAADMRRMREWLDKHSVEDLALVWDFFQLAPETANARRSGWAHKWASLCTERFPGRLRDARRWHSSGRQVDRDVQGPAPASRPRQPEVEYRPPTPEEEATPETMALLFRGRLRRAS